MSARRSLARSVAENEETNVSANSSVDGREASLGYHIRHAHRTFVRTLANELGPYRVTTGQWTALRVLWREEGLSQVELAQRLMVEKASLTTVLRAMEAEGLITRTRNGADRRKVNIYLTTAGRRLKSRILPLAEKINKRATRRLSDAEVRQLRALLARVMINLQN